MGVREGRRGDGSEGGGRGKGREERRWGKEERGGGERRTEEVGGGHGEGYRLMRAHKLTLVGKELMYLRTRTNLQQQ